MKIVIDTNDLDKFNLTIRESILLYAIKYPELDFNENDAIYKTLENKKFIKIDEKGKIVLRNRAEEFFNGIKSDVYTKVSTRTINQIIKERLHEFRSLWKGLAPGSMGSKKSCEEKLSRWIKENPEYSFDDILQAAKNYINSLGGNYKYLQRADYFIFKKEGKEESSRLSAFIEEVHLELPNADWTSNLN